MQEKTPFDSLVSATTVAAGRTAAESRAIRDAIWPEGMPTSRNIRYPVVLTEHAAEDLLFFDQPEWPKIDAIWMLATGEGPSTQKSEARALFERALSGDDDEWSERKPHKGAVRRAPVRILDSYESWFNSYCVFLDGLFVEEIFDVAVKLPYPRHFHEWIRWAMFFQLPVHRRFWDAYYAWKAARWTRGTAQAILSVLTADAWQPIKYGPAPSELTWHIPYTVDLELIVQQEAPVRFIHGWRKTPEQVLEVAENPGALHFWKKRNLRLSRGARTRIVGAPLEQRVSAAVGALADAFGLQPERDGRYFFGVEQALLMLWLVTIDPLLADRSPRSISTALPGLVRGKPSDGRPPRA